MVRQIRMLLCDSDNEYVDAVISYLMKERSKIGLNLSVVQCCCRDDVKFLKGQYDIGFFETGFISENDMEILGIKVVRVIYLTEEKSTRENSYYKYQSMDSFLALIKAEKKHKLAENQNKSGIPTDITCIYSPAGHELSTTFALSLCKYYSERERVLFIDIEDISIFSSITGIMYEKDLLDMVYMLGDKQDAGLFESYSKEYEGFMVLAPPDYPGQLSYISESQWISFFSHVNSLGFGRIVVLLGSLIQGFGEIMDLANQVVLLKKAGEFESLTWEVFSRYLGRVEEVKDYKILSLPFTGKNLVRGAYNMETLIKGKMLDYIRREFSERVKQPWD